MENTEKKDIFEELELYDCPICQGTGLLDESNGWIYVMCNDCGSQTGEVPYKTPEEREAVARKVVELWNMGKVIHTGIGD